MGPMAILIQIFLMKIFTGPAMEAYKKGGNFPKLKWLSKPNKGLAKVLTGIIEQQLTDNIIR